MPNYFVIRTSDDEKEWIWDNLQRGQLRQGWGLSGMELPRGEHTEEKLEEWCERYRRQGEHFWHEEIPKDKAESRYWILRPMLDIQTGDRIVIPKMPTWGSFCIAIANGSYEFDTNARPDPTDDDFRHVVPVQNELRCFPHLSGADAQIVASSLGGYQRAVNTVFKPSVQSALEALIRSQVPTTVGDVISIVNELGKAATDRVIDDLLNKLVGLQWNVFEQIIRKIVELGGYRIVQLNAYDREGGDADIIAEAELPALAAAFEHQALVLVQVKKKNEIDHNDVSYIDQLVRMAETYSGAALVVISTAKKFTDACISAAEDKGIVLIAGPTLVRLLLRYMP